MNLETESPAPPGRRSIVGAPPSRGGSSRPWLLTKTPSMRSGGLSSVNFAFFSASGLLLVSQGGFSFRHLLGIRSPSPSPDLGLGLSVLPVFPSGLVVHPSIAGPALLVFARPDDGVGTWRLILRESGPLPARMGCTKFATWIHSTSRNLSCFILGHVTAAVVVVLISG
jgi:hypothetical protein